jgi:tRNA (adenine22-N1)-methyltransferase
MLSKRLQTIYDLVDKNSNLADIGADHGFLLIELAKSNKCNLLLGVENKSGPYDKLVENIKINTLNDRIRTSLSDGLCNVPSDYNTIVIAGMGTENIIKIISNSIKKIDFIDTFIIDSHTKVDELRKFMVSIGYKISNEEILREDNIVYEIIKFVKGKINYSEIQYKYGPCLLSEKSDTFVKIYKEKVAWMKQKIKSTKNLNYIATLESNIEEIEAIIHEN